MLQKSKSKQSKLFKYALLIPIIFGMLLYTSCTKVKEEDLLNLEQYTHTLIEDETSTSQSKEVHDQYKAFLIENPTYVGWAEGDIKTGRTYTVHSINEEVPEHLTKVDTHINGSFYRMFIEYPAPSPSSSNTLLQKIEVSEKNNSQAEEVPFSIIDQVPVFSGCENLISNEERKQCTASKILDFVGRTFNTNIAYENDLIGRQRITVFFRIDKEGNLIDVQARAVHPALEAEAIRVIKSFPKMQPGKHEGKTVIVPYTLPIVLVVNAALE